MKIAIVHEWLDTYAGSERVVGQLLQCYPEADLFAVVDFLPPDERHFLQGRPVKTSFIQKLPFASKQFRNYLQLMPLAVQQFDLSDYDLVISSNHAVAKGVLTGPKQVHVSYVHSPIRYAWDLQGQYLREGKIERGLKSMYVRWLLYRMRIYDAVSANGVDLFLANSSYIARRIRKAYRREAVVIPPPVAVEDFTPGLGAREGFLVVSRFVPYKRVELIVEAFAQMPEHRLTVVGTGTNAALVEKAAAGAANITLRPPARRAELVALMQSARAMVFAAEEDFGITMVEAQACGTPVIAFEEGGARDIFGSVEDDTGTGVLFPEQSVAAIIAAVRQFEVKEPALSAAACRANAMRFSERLFRQRLMQQVDQAMSLARKQAAPAMVLAEPEAPPALTATGD